MKHQTGSFTGSGNTPIFTQAWLPDGAPRAVVLLAHGYAEHSGRYAHVGAALSARGYAVYALDHRGHGQSGGERAQVRDFDEYVADLHTCYEGVIAEQPGVATFVYGHSMGSLIALLFALRYQDHLAGLITTGTALKPAAANAALEGAVHLLAHWRPASQVVPALASSGISRDPEVVRRYDADPLVPRTRIKLGWAAAFTQAVHRCQAGLPALRLPYLALHGGADPITLPDGAAQVRARSGSPDTTVKVYDGLRHEIHNEPEQDQVFADILAWLDAHTSSTN